MIKSRNTLSINLGIGYKFCFYVITEGKEIVKYQTGPLNYEGI